MKRLFWQIPVVVILIFAGYLFWVLLQGTSTDFKPLQKAPVEVLHEKQVDTIRDSVLSFISWNAGYGGLGAESDFFFDTGALLSRGHMVHSPRNLVEKNIDGMEQFMQQTKSDFFLLQEVDRSSKRSYFADMLDSVHSAVPDYYASFAVNYQVQRVPVPLLEPWRVYGKVRSGLGTLSRFTPSQGIRYQLPGSFSWPTRIFQLDRCVAVHRYPVSNGKELVVYNIHNSAYDDGSLKAQQLDFLKRLFVEEYEKGNYVVAGGDWNQCPPYFPFNTFGPKDTNGYSQENISPEFLPSDWQWIYDPRVPTNRKIRDPYEPGETFVTLIDFFLISPNVQALTVRGLDQQFAYSDHQPVYLEISLKR
jgi:endonuclease/exonuclease/phosphatase family metal-dependent hydrolase